MLDKKIINVLRNRYPIHPLIFERSVDHARTNGELFDILDTMPLTFPLVWDEDLRGWVRTVDIFQSHEFQKD